MILLTVVLALLLHPQSPTAERWYPKADSVNASDIPQKDTNAENDAIIANLADIFVIEFVTNLDKENKLKKVD